MKALAEAKRILVVTKFKYFGDTIVATPFLRRLREGVPSAEITLLAGAVIPTVLKGCPYVGELWPFDPRSNGGISGSLPLIARMKRAGFDAVFLLNRSLHSAILASMARIPIRVGHQTEHRGALLTHRVPYDWTKPDRICSLDLLKAVGLNADPALPEMWISEQERAKARERLEASGSLPGRLLVGMQPGANDPEVREWGAERFAEVADTLIRDRNAVVLLFGGEEQKATTQRMVSAMKGTAQVFTGETSLRESLALISQCNLWIGNDGGLLHAAVALGPATVGIFGPTKAARWGYNEPRHKTVVVHPDESAGDPRTIRRCLDAISPEMVLSQAYLVLGVGRT